MNIELGIEGWRRHPVDAAKQHLAIVQAIRDGDPDAAAREIQRHIQTTFESYEREVRHRMNSDVLIP